MPPKEAPLLPRLMPAVLIGLLASGLLTCGRGPGPETAGPGPTLAAAAQPAPYAGSESCRTCHQRFYDLWASSFHGKAMQPFTAEFARQHLTAQAEPITIAGKRYQIHLDGAESFMSEAGPDGTVRYAIAHVLGGKYLYYFLTPLPRGRFQVMPLAYHVEKKQWYDTTASMVRHTLGDTALPWTDPLLTFNTACRGCHVSQYQSHYDPAADRYETTWAEPGINCETCHGPASEHNRVCLEAPKGTVPKDLKIISAKTFTTRQRNDTCNQCHAKALSITAGYRPPEPFFDHFDLLTLEDPDFYPDGRDLGENFTMTTWLMSPCYQAGKLDCMHCHTSSGRYRFADPAAANGACLPCHRQRVEQSAEHSHHKPGTPGDRCVSCHMPKTDFARMNRSDHSMRPPAPAATLAFKSPNACNICHKDKDPQWADAQVRSWRTRDYQAPVLETGRLIQAARARDWSALDAMLARLTADRRDEVLAASLIRLLAACPDPRKWPAIESCLNDPSPLVRSAAAHGLIGSPRPESLAGLLAAVGDPIRLVRVRAAGALAGVPRDCVPPARLEAVEKASRELVEGLTARPDDWASHYNLGNYYLSRGRVEAAAASFETAHRLRPDTPMPLVNLAIAYARLGRDDRAEQALRRALAADPNSAAARFNLGLLLAGQNRTSEARSQLAEALRLDPTLAPAAYNLGLLMAQAGDAGGLAWLAAAARLEPDQTRYAYSLAFFQDRLGKQDEALKTLDGLRRMHPADADAVLLACDIHLRAGRKDQARGLLEEWLRRQDLPPEARARGAQYLDRLRR